MLDENDLDKRISLVDKSVNEINLSDFADGKVRYSVLTMAYQTEYWGIQKKNGEKEEKKEVEW